MPHAVWVGDLGFGLVNVPVRLYGATAPRTVRFHHYEAGTGRRIRYRRVAEGPAPELRPPPEGPEPPRTGGEDDAAHEPAPLRRDPAPAVSAEVGWEDVVKGVEVEPGRVVTFERDELDALAPEPSRVLEVEQFVDLADIDPVHFDKSYYVVPERGVAERAYWLLYRAMEEAGKVAVGRFVLRTKEHLAAVRAGEHALTLHTLFYADEVRDPKDVGVVAAHDADERELDMARRFLGALAGKWEPDRHRDEHRERLLELLRSKAGDARRVPEPAGTAPEPSTVADLMAALTASVEAATRARDDGGSARPS